MAGSHRDVHLFGVRHHSPRTSIVLRRWLDTLRPKVVLIEGPSDANHLIEHLVDAATVPPVAILAYRTDGTPASSMWPFAAYSPEYVALKWAHDAGAEVRFIDVTSGQSLARDLRPTADEHDDGHRNDDDHEDDGDADDGDADDGDADDGDADDGDADEPAGAMDLTADIEPSDAEHDARPSDTEPRDVERLDIWAQVAERAGFRSFEEFWEASFEAPDYDEASFRSALLAYAELVRHKGPGRSFHRARDAFMAEQIDQTIAQGVDPSAIVVVLGAAHAAAMVAGDVDPSLLRSLTPSVPTLTTLVPYSFTRLAEQTGYGAGNRAPQFYQRAWDAGGSYRRAALEVLVHFSDHLRLRGFASSLADTIEAYRLALTLATIRGKSEPGLDEIREATIATMCRGDGTHVDSFLWSSVIGKNIGKVASRVGKNSLQEEFWSEVEERRLPSTDEAEEFVLKLGDEVHVATSVFLHRLRVGGIPYALYRGSSNTSAGVMDTGEEAGGFSALTRPREAWQAQWTPATEVALVERIVLGDSIADVCRRLLAERLADATTTAAAADVLLESVITNVPETLATALSACDRLASTDEDLPSLASACRSLSGLVAYGSSRDNSALGAAAIGPLCTKTFVRAVLRVKDAAEGNEDAVGPVKGAMRVLHELAMAQPLVDKQAWFEAALALVDNYAIHPSCAGLAAGLMYLAREMSEAEITALVERRLSDTLAPERGAEFLSGFLEVNALVLVKSRPIVAALDEFLISIEPERFRDALPAVRRAFSMLGATERRYLVDNLLSLRKVGAAAIQGAQIIAAKDKEMLASISNELADAMDDLDDLL